MKKDGGGRDVGGDLGAPRDTTGSRPPLSNTTYRKKTPCEKRKSSGRPSGVRCATPESAIVHSWGAFRGVAAFPFKNTRRTTGHGGGGAPWRVGRGGGQKGPGAPERTLPCQTDGHLRPVGEFKRWLSRLRH
ncbi:hypothetical protein ISCGN_014015 [Ixodes scapularis]